MSSSTKNHSRSHSLLLLQKLLSLRDGASPLTLVLDNLEQKARPLISEFITRAKISKSKIIFCSFTTLKKPTDVDVFIKAAGQDLRTLRSSLLPHVPAIKPAALKDKTVQRVVLIIDSLNYLAALASSKLATFLSSIISPAISMVGVYHTDVPVVLPRSFNEYEPQPFTVLCHLATAILRLSSLWQEIERQKARNMALVEPEWGLEEGREGVLVGLCPNRKGNHDAAAAAAASAAGGDVVVAMELRRPSGSTVSERFIFLTPPKGTAGPGKLLLLTDHPLFSPSTEGPADGDEEGPESTFHLGLTEKQRKDREGIVLPYFDAQSDIGSGEGGRILYEMGREDDFDDEEDEI